MNEITIILLSSGFSLIAALVGVIVGAWLQHRFNVKELDLSKRLEREMEERTEAIKKLTEGVSEMTTNMNAAEMRKVFEEIRNGQQSLADSTRAYISQMKIAERSSGELSQILPTIEKVAELQSQSINILKRLADALNEIAENTNRLR